MADNLDQVTRSSSPNFISTDYRALRIILENPISHVFPTPDMSDQSASSHLRSLFEAALQGISDASPAFRMSSTSSMIVELDTTISS